MTWLSDYERTERLEKNMSTIFYPLGHGEEVSMGREAQLEALCNEPIERTRRVIMGQLRIESCEPSKSGKSMLIKSGGQTYYSKPEMGLKDHIGALIEAEISTSDYKGNEMLWINKFKVVEAGTSKSYTRTSASEIIGVAPIWQPLVSNCLAACITSGLIKQPEDIKQWALAAKRAIEAAYKDDSGEIGF